MRHSVRAAGSAAWLLSAAIGPRVLLEAETGAGAAVNTDPAPAGAGGQPSGGDPQLPSGPFRPEGLPDHLFGENDRATIERLWGSVKGFRELEATRGAVPKDPTGYVFEPSEELKPFVGELDSDPLWNGIRADAHQLGVTDKVFGGLMNKILTRMVSEGLVEKPVDFQAELTALVPEAAAALPADQQKQEVQRRIGAALGYAKGLTNHGLDQASVDALIAVADTAAGVKLIEWIQGQNRDPRPALGGSGGGSGETADSLRQAMADPRADRNSTSFDPTYAAAVAERYKKFYGT